MRLQAIDIHQSYRSGDRHTEVLKGLTVEARTGEKLFLCGPSGAGKTTLLYVLAGLEAPKTGKVLIDDRSIYQLNRQQRALMRSQTSGFIFQRYFLLPELTAFENVLSPSMISGSPKADRARELLQLVGLGDRLEHLPDQLSGGEQQRVAIARALINDPGIIFADEPTGNLDRATGGEVMGLLLSLVEESRKTLIVVTHDPGLARLGDRVLTLQDGRLT